MAFIKKEILLPPEVESIRIDLVVQQLTNLPRSVIRGMFDHDCITINGEACDDPGLKVSRGESLGIKYDTETRYKEKPKSHKSKLFDVIFEDDHLIVVNKKPGCLTSPSNGYEKNTLMEAVTNHVNRGQKRARPVTLIHRLDRETSGLLIFAKNSAVGAKIKDQFEGRKPERVYVAIVAGQLKESSGTFRSFLATDKDLNQRSVLESEGGKLAVTHFKVEKILSDATLIRVTLETGRRNQIRVHFAENGHPVLGDLRYESDLAKHRHWNHRRLALHAEVLGFSHPVTGRPVKFRVAAPNEFDQFCSMPNILKS